LLVLGGVMPEHAMTTPLPPLTFRLACAALAAAFVYSGVSKLLHFDAALGEAAHFGLQPAALFAVATIVTQLGGAAAMLLASGRLQALGATALAGFTVVATLIGHAFWTMDGMERFHNLNSFIEHIGLVGGLMLVAALAWPRRVAAAP
jgi:transmembrane protein